MRLTLDRRLLRATGSAIGVTVGFIAVFVALGILFDSVADRFRENFPWVTIIIGVFLMVAGLATIFGHSLRLVAPISVAARSRGATGMVIYGGVYALASLSCTIGPFLSITGVAMERSVPSGIATYVTYGLGMGVVVLVIAAASALARPRPIHRLRQLSQYAGVLGGTLMILGGAYATWYGRWELAVYNGDLNDDRIVNAGEKLRIDLIQFIEWAGALRATIIVLAVISAAIVVGRFARPDHGGGVDGGGRRCDLEETMTEVESARRLERM